MNTQKEPVPQAVIFDFDRTIGNVANSMTRLLTVAEKFDINTQELKRIQLDTEADGGSFDPLTPIYDALNNDEKRIEQFNSEFISAAEPPILYDDVAPFLSSLRKHNIPFLILSYGVNPKWQDLKFKASDLVDTATVIEHRGKGSKIAGWKQEGKYVIENKNSTRRTVVAASVCVIDDKASEFMGLPAGAAGFYLKRQEKLLPSQQGELPSGVTIDVIHTLNDIAVKDGTLVHI